MPPPGLPQPFVTFTTQGDRPHAMLPSGIVQVYGKPPPHVVLCLLTIFTCGLCVILWIGWAM